MRADKCAVVALDALFCVPFRNGNSDAALLVSGGAEREGAVCVINELGYGQGIAVHTVNRIENVVDHLDGLGKAGVLADSCLVFCGLPALGNFNLRVGCCAGVDCVVVHVNDILALLEVGVESGILHVADRLCLRQNLCEGEESRLENGVGALAHADLLGKVNSIDHVKLDIVVGNVALGSSIEMMLEFLEAPLAVDEEDAAGLYITGNGEALHDVGRNMAGNKVSLVDVVRALDGLVAKAQMADGDAAGLLGVVLEVCLNVLVGMVADDLAGVLVGTDCTVTAETPEFALDGACTAWWKEPWSPRERGWSHHRRCRW